MSTVANAMIINAVVLAAVLEADLGRHRKISWFRIARPLVLAAVLVPIYIKGFAGHGTGLTLELTATAAGLLLGLAATALMRVYRSPRTAKPVSRAGFGYAALWVVVIGARAAFSYGSTNWFGPQLGHWMASNAVTTAAITDSLLLMAVGMMLARTLGLVVRAARLPEATAASSGQAVTAEQPSGHLLGR